MGRVSAHVTFEEGREGRVPVAVREQDLVGRVHHVGVEVCGQAAPVQGRLGRQGRETCGCRRGVHVPPMGAWVGATDTRRLTLTGTMAWICGGASLREAPGTQGVATLPDPWRLASVMRWVSPSRAPGRSRGGRACLLADDQGQEDGVALGLHLERRHRGVAKAAGVRHGQGHGDGTLSNEDMAWVAERARHPIAKGPQPG